MSQSASAVTLAAPSSGRLHALLATAWRYGLSTAGPVAVSGAHFIASVIFLRDLHADQFGLFSFALILGALAMSVTGAAFALPATRSVVAGEKRDTDACFKMSLAANLSFTLLIGVLLWFGGAASAEALPLALFGALSGYRWFARALAYAHGRITAAILSDLVYSGIILVGLGLMELSKSASLAGGGQLLLLASVLSFLPFGKAFVLEQLGAIRGGRLKSYLPIFRELTGWSVLGVVLTEATLNAHAYLVTLIAGPGAFALPALGMLLMRPASLVQSSLPDLERPAMMRAIAAGNERKLARILRQFQWGLLAALAATVALALAIIIFRPHLLLVYYRPHDVLIVLGFAALIMAARSLRTPPAVLLQAAGEFKLLARISFWSALVSVGSTLALLLAFGPSISMGGILLGDIVILVAVWTVTGRMKLSDGRLIHG
jgi:O-antigen/teichoic acid export membrane protein